MTHAASSPSLPVRDALPRRLTSVRLLPVLLAITGAAAAQTIDFSINKLEVNQAIQAGATPLVGGRTTWVRTSVRVVNPTAPTNPVDGLLRIFVDGVETPDSPVFSDNGPFPAKQVIDPSVEDGTLNFIFLAPTSNNVVLTVQVNPPGPNFVPEFSTLNDTASTPPLVFAVHQPAELAYVPIDYRPDGGTIPNLPPLDQIEPGMGDNFVAGIYPVSDWYYHRTDAPSKLWTQSLAGTGSDLLNSLNVDIVLMSPVPDFLYAWVPGALPYNGQSIIGGKVAMGNTELIRYQRTIAHEMGHNFGLQHNTLTTGLIGVDVEHQLNLTQGLPQIKAATLKDIMYAGLLTQEAWVASPSYSVFYNSPVFAPGVAADSDEPAAPRLMVNGTWNRLTGELQASDVLTAPSAHSTPPTSGAAELVLRAWAGGKLLSELPLAITDTADACRDADSGAPGSPVVGFSAVLAPAGGGAVIDRVVVTQVGAHAGTALELRRSPTAPVVAFTTPAAALTSPKLNVTWSASDADGDALHFYLRYSPDGTRFVPLATGISEPQADVDLSQLPRFAAGHGFFELLASDGFNTTVTRSQPLQRAPSYADSAGGNPPWIYIATPDPDYTFLKGATVVLHGSGWDLEDNGLSGGSMVWTSDVDGFLGTGRLTKVTTLSAGQHVITLTGTDSDGMTSVDTANITIVDRGLPDVGLFCQQDIGFQGPGLSVLTMCGGNLSTGTTAYIQLLNAPSFAATMLFGGFSNSPTPFKGGLLVPVPMVFGVPLVTDAAGEFLINDVPGGGGPVTLYLQCATADAGQPKGVSLSNALKVQFLP